MRGTRLFVLVLMAVAAGSLAQAQRVPDKPLGDVAREQRDARKLRSKKDSQNIYTNQDGASPKVTAESAAGKTPAAAPADPAPPESTAPSPQPALADHTLQKTAQSAGSAVDPQEDTSRDVLVIPAGTQIRVEVPGSPYGRIPPEEGTVIVSVPLGSAMGIPARSKVILRSIPSTGGNQQVFVAVVAISVRGATYAMHTNALPLPASRKNSELDFTLVESLSLP